MTPEEVWIGEAARYYETHGVNRPQGWMPETLLEDEEAEAAYQLTMASVSRAWAERWAGWDGLDEPEPDEAVELPGRFRIYAEAALGDYPAVEWFPGLEGYLPMRELVGLYGPGDSYKSFTALDWACWIALSGREVLYIAAEGVSGLRGRIAAWKAQHGVEELPCLHVQPLPVRMHDERDVAALVACVHAQMRAPELVVVDTLARNFVGGNENSAQDMGLFVEGAEQIRTAFRCTVAVVHHSTKDGSSERGGESLRNASFAMYSFERKSRTSVVVTCERMKDAERPAPITLTPAVMVVGEDAEGLPVTSLVASWPFGTESVAPLFDESDTAGAAKRVKMIADIVEVVRSWGSNGDTLSQNQVQKRVHGNDGAIGSLLKEIALDPYSPVQSRKTINADGSTGKTVEYFYADPVVA